MAERLVVSRVGVSSSLTVHPNKEREREMQVPEEIQNFAHFLRAEAQGRLYVVGGAVRDSLLGKEPYDYDLEVHEVPQPKLEALLGQFFENVQLTGQRFGVYKAQTGEGHALDISLPRSDSKAGTGHAGFSVLVDPYLGIAQALRRRDFTIGAIAYDVLAATLVDPYRGHRDLLNRTLDIVDPRTFGDDPLRVLRGLQFISRFNLRPSERALIGMAKCVPALREISPASFWTEWRKLLVGRRPTEALQYAQMLGVLSLHQPQFDLLPFTPQDARHHPEGNVWRHTELALNQAEWSLGLRPPVTNDQRCVILLAVLLHDIGKPLTTQQDATGKITAYEHHTVGAEFARNFLLDIGAPASIREKVCKLVAQHMWAHWSFKDAERVSDGAFRRLARSLAPATIIELAAVSDADLLGRGWARSGAFMPDIAGDWSDEARWLLKRAGEVAVLTAPPTPFLQGRDLLAVGLTPGPQFKAIIAFFEAFRDAHGQVLAWEEFQKADWQHIPYQHELERISVEYDDDITP